MKVARLIIKVYTVALYSIEQHSNLTECVGGGIQTHSGVLTDDGCMIFTIKCLVHVVFSTVRVVDLYQTQMHPVMLCTVT